MKGSFKFFACTSCGNSHLAMTRPEECASCESTTLEKLRPEDLLA